MKNGRKSVNGSDLGELVTSVASLTAQKRRQDRRTPKLLDVGLMRLAFAQLEALEFSGGGFGEFGEEFDPAWALIAADAFGDKIL